MSNLEIGKKIKCLRKGKGVTQETLAKYLGVTTQAVSKWENEATAPDIFLLPNISVYFGVTIDELFSLTDDAKLERINNMIWERRYMAKDEFNDSEDFLKEIIDNHKNTKELRLRATEILCWLYIKRAEEYKEMASDHARDGIQLAPFSSLLHKALNNSHMVPLGDWNVTNHSERITYYKEFIKQDPSHRTGYMWLLDSLINDGRLREAKETLDKYEEIARDDWRTMYYAGLIEIKQGNKDKGEDILNDMVNKYQDTEGPYFDKATIHAYNGEWEEAISCYEKDFSLSAKPRYVDALEAIAKIYEIMGDNKKAIETYNRYIDLIRDEWDTKEGELIDYPRRQIKRLIED